MYGFAKCTTERYRSIFVLNDSDFISAKYCSSILEQDPTNGIIEVGTKPKVTPIHERYP